MEYEAVIGLEIHAELMTDSKMFTGAPVVDSVEAEPNTAVQPLCLGMPGMLPVVNETAVAYAMQVALALNCTINQHNVFARKNYFYPDLPKGYQISQYEQPIGVNGWLDIVQADGQSKRVRIRRVHMEEDTGKLTHINDTTSLVDYNRAGVPLLEIVTEPDIQNGEEARAYAMQVRQILRYLRVNSGDMEKGVLRVEPNISIRPIGTDELNNRTELKNLNSFKVLLDGTDYEIKRQTKVVQKGGTVVQETRGWSEERRVTFSQRIKEEAEDYRYFPDPDIPPLFIEQEAIEAAKASLPELPSAKRSRYIADMGLSAYDASVLSEERAVAEWFDSAIALGGDSKLVANWLINNLFALMNEYKQSIEDIKVTPAKLVELIGMVTKQTINNNTAKKVLGEMFKTGESPSAIAKAQNLTQISDEGAIVELIDHVIANNPNDVAEFVAGKDKLRGWFMGQVMQAAKGKANPKLVNRLLSQKLNELKKNNQ